MTGYYEQWEKDFARAYRFRLPIIMEGGWITGAHHRYWIDPSGKYRQGHSEDVRWGEYEESRNAHVNMMDLRIGDEVASWFNSSFDLVKRFEREGGYRLYPTEVSFVNKARSGERVSVQHNWRNLGWGYCPTNIPQWKGKYKVCIALMDANHNIVKNSLQMRLISQLGYKGVMVIIPQQSIWMDFKRETTLGLLVWLIQPKHASRA